MSKCFRLLSVAATAAFLSSTFAACDFLGLGAPSGPGELHAYITSPNQAEGAAVLELTSGLSLGTITSNDGDVFYRHEGGTTRLVVILHDPGEITFHMRVDELSEIPSVTIVQVADGNNELRSSVSEYEVEWVQIADGDRYEHRSAR